MFRKIKKDRSNILWIFFMEFIVAIALILVAYFLNDYEIVHDYALYAMLLYFLLILFLNIFIMYRFLNKAEKYLNRTDITIASIFGNEVAPVFEFGNIVILVYNEVEEVVWLSQTTLLKKEDILGQKIYELIPNFDELALQTNAQDVYVELGGKTFQIEINIGMRVIYMKDTTSLVLQNNKMEKERPFIGHVVIDNYQDVIISLQENQFVMYVTEVKELINNFAKKYNLFIRSYGNDSFLIIGEEENYLNIVKDKFSIMDEMRKMAEKSDNPLTISIGIGKGNTTSILRTSEISYMALNMALSRGGDQVVVNTFGKPLEYYGAKNEVKQTRSHVRGRVLAVSLANLIKSSKNVIITGHKNADFDAIGASLGIYAICKNLKVNAYVLYEDDLIELYTKRAFKQTFTPNEIAEMTINNQKALQIANEQTLLIIVDTHSKDMILLPKLVEICKDICVIDHHRKGDSFIDNPIFQYHEPQSSSASELVTELIFYQAVSVNLSENIANFLLAGISLDTKFFKVGTSGKTFEMAMILKNYQASSEVVSDFFREEYEEKKLLSSIVNSATALAVGVYMAKASETDIITRTTLSKVADEILNIKGVQAVFVVGRTAKNQVSISARSTPDFNVQLIMEALGGGGHFSKAATQMDNVSVNDAVNSLKEKIKIFLRDGGRV